MELLLINFLEDNQKERYEDVEIVNYSIDGVQCEVTFTHVEPMKFETCQCTKSVNLWDVMAHINYNLNK